MENGYAYGMRLRGFSPGCQPMAGLIDHIDDLTGEYYDILIYDHMLTEDQINSYELTYIGKAERHWEVEI